MGSDSDFDHRFGLDSNSLHPGHPEQYRSIASENRPSQKKKFHLPTILRFPGLC